MKILSLPRDSNYLYNYNYFLNLLFISSNLIQNLTSTGKLQRRQRSSDWSMGWRLSRWYCAGCLDRKCTNSRAVPRNRRIRQIRSMLGIRRCRDHCLSCSRDTIESGLKLGIGSRCERLALCRSLLQQGKRGTRIRSEQCRRRRLHLELSRLERCLDG